MGDEASEVEVRAQEIIFRSRESESLGRKLYGSLPEELGPSQKRSDIGRRFPVKTPRIERSQLFEIARAVSKGAHLHMHFNLESPLMLHPIEGITKGPSADRCRQERSVADGSGKNTSTEDGIQAHVAEPKEHLSKSECVKHDGKAELERKQRNRQAQAAFRERRREYIKQLEATIKRNEETLGSLQQSHRSAADEVSGAFGKQPSRRLDKEGLRDAKLAAFAFKNDFMVFRRFGNLQSRALFYMQNKILVLEQKLEPLDKSGVQKSTLPVSTILEETIDDDTRAPLLEALRAKISQYDNLIRKSSSMVELARPGSSEYRSCVSYLNATASHDDLLENGVHGLNPISRLNSKTLIDDVNDEPRIYRAASERWSNTFRWPDPFDIGLPPKKLHNILQAITSVLLLNFSGHLGVFASPLRGGTPRPQGSEEQLATEVLSLPGPWLLAISGIGFLFSPLPTSEEALRELRLSVHLAALVVSGLWLILLTTVPEETQVLAYSGGLWLLVYPSHIRICAKAAKNQNLRMPFVGATALLMIAIAVILLACGSSSVVQMVVVAGMPVATAWTLLLYGALRLHDWLMPLAQEKDAQA